MKKYILVLLILVAAVVPFFMFGSRYSQEKIEIDLDECHQNLLDYLKIRKDKLALIETEKILAVEPNDLCGLWAKAEIFRRTYKFKESKNLLNQILSKNPDYAPALISLAYIKYHDNKFDEAYKTLAEVLKQPDLNKENAALVYMLMGSINARKASLGGFLCKVLYGLRVRGLFEKARDIAPDLPEIRLGLGSFYLLAPTIAGGNVDRAIRELKYAVELAPDFATANARLAEAYKEKEDFENYNFYLKRAEDLDPENEVLKEIKK